MCISAAGSDSQYIKIDSKVNAGIFYYTCVICSGWRIDILSRWINLIWFKKPIIFYPKLKKGDPERISFSPVFSSCRRGDMNYKNGGLSNPYSLCDNTISARNNPVLGRRTFRPHVWLNNKWRGGERVFFFWVDFINYLFISDQEKWRDQ